MLSTARKAPSSAPPTAIQVLGGTAASNLASIVASRLPVDLAATERGQDRVVRRFSVDRRFDGHSWTQPAGERVALLQRNLDRDALDDLGEVAGGVIRGQECELLPAGGRHAFDTAGNPRPPESRDRNFFPLSGPPGCHLRRPIISGDVPL